MSQNFYECHFSPGKDARRLVILKGDLENSGDRGSLVKEDIAKKYISYFHSILHHNNGYFCLVTKAYMYQCMPTTTHSSVSAV